MDGWMAGYSCQREKEKTSLINIKKCTERTVVSVESMCVRVRTVELAMAMEKRRRKASAHEQRKESEREKNARENDNGRNLSKCTSMYSEM